jgi:hypothetical protein
MASSDIVHVLRGCLTESEPQVVAAYLFGSSGRGEARETSDLDVAVLLRGAAPRTLDELPLSLAAEIEQATGRRVDLVVLNSAPVDLVHRVLRDGVLLLDRERAARLRFEVGARNRFFDLLPVLREYRRPRASAP